MFDKFFDCMNVRSFTECFEKRKPDRRPYRSSTDPRFDVSALAIYFFGVGNNVCDHNAVATGLFSGLHSGVAVKY